MKHKWKKGESLHNAVVLSVKEEIDVVILKRESSNQAILDPKDNKTKYAIQIDKNNSADLQKKFYDQSSLT